MRRPSFPPFAKTQAFGMALGFALALYALVQLELDLRLFLIASAGAWLAWEFLLGPRAPSHKSDTASLAYALAAGFSFPWIGLGLTALAAWGAP